MCNQCQDARAIHSGKIVWGVLHNGQIQMILGTEDHARRSMAILDGSKGSKYCQCREEDPCTWELFQIERKDVSWEGRK